MEGYREEENIDNEEEKKCIDINECVESQNLCPVGTYCANTEGSYTCEGKHDWLYLFFYMYLISSGCFSA